MPLRCRRQPAREPEPAVHPAGP